MKMVRGPIDPRLGGRRVTLTANAIGWSHLYHKNSKSPGIFAKDRSLQRAAGWLAWGEDDANTFKSAEKEKDGYYKDRVLNRPYQTILTVDGVTELVDVTTAIRISKGDVTELGNYSALYDAAQTGNYVVSATDAFGGGFSVFTVQDGFITRDAHFDHLPNKKEFYMSSESVFTTVLENTTTTKTQKGLFMETKTTFNYTSYETVNKYDVDGKLISQETKTHKFSMVTTTSETIKK